LDVKDNKVQICVTKNKKNKKGSEFEWKSFDVIVPYRIRGISFYLRNMGRYFYLIINIGKNIAASEPFQFMIINIISITFCFFLPNFNPVIWKIMR